MKRDPRLHRLSSEHHYALVLARRATRGELSVEEARRAFDVTLSAHFAVEERRLLPALVDAGEVALAERTRLEHAAIARALESGDLLAFGRLLTEHVRFEERELFPACEPLLTGDGLDAIAAQHLP